MSIEQARPRLHFEKNIYSDDSSDRRATPEFVDRFKSNEVFTEADIVAVASAVAEDIAQLAQQPNCLTPGEDNIYTITSLATERLIDRLDVVRDARYYYVPDEVGELQPIALEVVWDAIDRIRTAVIQRIAQLLDARPDVPRDIVDQLYFIARPMARSVHTGHINVETAERLGGRDYVVKQEHTGLVREDQRQAYSEIVQLLERQPQPHIQPLALAYDAKRRRLIGRRLPLSTLQSGLDRLKTEKMDTTKAKQAWLELLTAVQQCMAAEQFLFDNDYYVADLKPENIGINTETNEGVIFDLGYCGKLTKQRSDLIAQKNIVREFGETLNAILSLVSGRQLRITVEVLPELAEMAMAMRNFGEQPTLADCQSELAGLIAIEQANTRFDAEGLTNP